MRLLVSMAAMAGVLCAAGAGLARAEEERSDGYRVEMAVASASSIGLYLAGNAFEREGSVIPDAMMAVGAISYPLAGPVIHARHHRYGRALASLGMRVGLPITFGIIGARSAPCGQDSIGCGLDELGLGMMIGAVLAAVLDTTLLSGPAEASGQDTTARTDATAAIAETELVRCSAGPTATLASTLTPTVAASSNLAFVGLGGRF